MFGKSMPNTEVDPEKYICGEKTKTKYLGFAEQWHELFSALANTSDKPLV